VIQFVASRILVTLPLLLAVSLIVFGLGKSIPGDPVKIYLSQADINNPTLVEQLREKYALNSPIPLQYWRWLSLAVRGDLGESIRQGAPVSSLVFQGLRNTASIATAAVLEVVLVGWTMGIIAAIAYNRQWPAAITRFLALFPVLLFSIPSFSIAIAMVIVFAIDLGWLPSGGVASARVGGGSIGDLALHMVMPTIALGVASIGANWRLARNSMIEVLREDYIRTAYAKGLPLIEVLFVHALRNAITPLVTSAGLLFGALLTGSFILEFIFAWPGIGRLMVESVLFRDLPVVMGGTLVLATIYLAINLLVDVLYTVIDPRIRYG
jgi:ABC-type dipeptide/oligopeptide/nickel transport system permease component